MDNITNNSKKLIIKLEILVVVNELASELKIPNAQSNNIINPDEIKNVNKMKNILFDKSLGILFIVGCLKR
jgi:hypothetical protein